MSLAGRLLNVFAAPSEVFDDVKSAAPSIGNWLVPLLLAAVVGTMSVIIMFSQPAMLRQIHEQQVKAMEDNVSSGKMSRAQADQAEAMLEKFNGPTFMMITGSIGAVISSVLRIFWWTFILWLLALIFLKTKLDFMKLLEAAGLATMITVLATIVTMLLTVILGKVSTPSLALLVKDFDPKNGVHLALAAVNPFSFWQVWLMAVALARISGARVARTLTLTTVYWIVVQLFLIGLVLITSAVFSGVKSLSNH